MDDDQTATIRYYTTGAYDGPGWYWLDAEYPEEGGVGAFANADEAIANARDCGYVAYVVAKHPHPPSWPRCACDRCFAFAARAIIGDALPALVASAFTLPATPAPQPAAAPPRKPRRKPARRRARPPVDYKPASPREVVQPKAEPPLVVAPPVDDVPAPEPAARPRRGPGRPRKVPAAAPETLESFPASPETAPAPTAAEVDAAPAPARACRVCGTSEPASWAQADLCAGLTCLGMAARAGRDRAAAKRAPAAAKAKRLSRIARIVGRRDRLAAAAERAEQADDDGEDLVERLDRVPEVIDA